MRVHHPIVSPVADLLTQLFNTTTTSSGWLSESDKPWFLHRKRSGLNDERRRIDCAMAVAAAIAGLSGCLHSVREGNQLGSFSSSSV
jgi:hypothetical protein